MSPMASISASKVRAAALRRCALSFEKASWACRRIDRVQIGRVLGQEQHPRAFGLHGGLGFGALVDREIVEDDDIAGRKRWGELGLDVDVEGLPVHCAGDHPWGGQGIVT